MADLISVFMDTAVRAGSRPALVDGTGSVIGFTALTARASAFAGRLNAMGIGKGDRVLIAMPVGIDLYIALAGAWSVGAVVVFPEPALGLSGLNHALKMTHPVAFLASGPYRWLHFLVPTLWGLARATPSARDKGYGPFVPLASDDLALISFTSGSTGAPKAIPRSHGFLMAQRDAVTPLLGQSTDTVDLVAFPMFVLPNLAAGRTSILPAWSMRNQGTVTGPALASWIERTSATRLLLPPALCEALATHNVPSRVTDVFTGGGPVFPDIVDALRHRRDDLRVVSVYGSTEAEPIAELNADDVTDSDRIAMSQGHGLLAGYPVETIHLRIVDDEIQVAGEHVNKGYLNPARDAENKIREGGTVWHRTGDAGRLDAHGRLWLLGRLTAIASHDNGTIYPFSVETAARSWAGVRCAALCRSGDRLALAIEGDSRKLPHWRIQAGALGIDVVRHVTRMPMDRRHRSKVDYAALATVLRRSHGQ
ncbi:AMP-binding protein [Arhodomonas sp. AD133]|uniref:AMP-binding protein n=1 Tax=Arhodomonas sp. AD133 TaxID=3415009 RepID=UPI003EB7D016